MASKASKKRKQTGKVERVCASMGGGFEGGAQSSLDTAHLYVRNEATGEYDLQPDFYNHIESAIVYPELCHDNTDDDFGREVRLYERGDFDAMTLFSDAESSVKGDSEYLIDRLFVYHLSFRELVGIVKTACRRLKAQDQTVAHLREHMQRVEQENATLKTRLNRLLKQENAFLKAKIDELLGRPEDKADSQTASAPGSS